MIDKKQFADNLQRLRLKNNLTLRDLADKLSISYGAVCKYEKGSQPPFETINKLAEIFNVSVSSLLGENELEVINNKCIKVPILNYVQAGEFTTINDYEDNEYIPMEEKYINCFVLKIKGKSMQPLFNEGDLITIDPLKQPTSGSYVVATIKDETEATFKKYREKMSEDGQLYFELVPLNSDFPTYSSLNRDIIIKGVAIMHTSII